MTPKSIPRVLIPAAGFGKRVGSPEAKEMMAHPETGMPLISRPLLMSLERGWQPLVITRAEKINLISYVEKFAGAEIMLIEESREWPHTLLQSAPRWNDINLVFLPDTEFTPAKAFDRLHGAVAEQGLSFGVFNVEDGKDWGVVRYDGENLMGCEKPQDFSDGFAWGLFGFRREKGVALLHKMLASTFDHQWKKLDTMVDLIALESFQDFTRT